MSIKKLPEDIKEVFNEIDDIMKNYPDVQEVTEMDNFKPRPVELYDVDVDEDGPFIVSMDENEWENYKDEEK